MAKAKSKKRTIAQDADKYALYRLSVQDPDHEVPHFERFYKDKNGESPKVLREDFCAAAAVCCAWVQSGKDKKAIGIDLDPEPLAYGEANYLSLLSDDERARVKLYQENVLTTRHKADVIAAQNYSFYCFKDRATLLSYFKAVHASLNKDGIFVADMLGGSAMQDGESEESRQVKRPPPYNKLLPSFKYVWEQETFNPITHESVFHISFRFTDDSALERCFTYDWRLWTLPEVRELLTEAGFSQVHVYWETLDKDGNESGNYRRTTVGRSDRVWLCYVVAER